MVKLFYHKQYENNYFSENEESKLNEAEIKILDFIRKHMTNETGDAVMPLISSLGDAGIVWIILALTMIIIPKTRRYGLIIAVSLIIESLLCNLLLKPVTARIRPYDVNPLVDILVKKPNDYSFPSGHTGASFAAASSLWGWKKRFWIPVTVLASLIGFSRMYLYVHYPTDVLSGVLLGSLSGGLSVLIFRKYAGEMMQQGKSD